MPTEFQCPGCDSVVLVPDQAAAIIGHDEQLGCGNVDEHDARTSLVMWPADDD